MNILNSVIKLFVGDKQQKDLKGLQPVVEDVKKFELAFSKLSHDELRAKTIEFKERIKDARKVDQSLIFCHYHLWRIFFWSLLLERVFSRR